MKIYRLLWFDDEFTKFESIVDNFNKQYIDVTGFSNALDGIKELKSNYENYDAILLDGQFYQDANQKGTAVDDRAFSKVAKILSDFKAKKIVMPWFMYSGQQNFFKDKSGNIGLFKDMNFANGKVFDKNKDEDFNELCREIKRSVDAKPENKIKLKYADVFQIFQNQFLDHKSEKSLVELIILAESVKREPINELTKLRKILEKLIDRALTEKLIPEELGSNNLSQAIHFLCGRNNTYRLSKNYFHSTINQVLVNFLYLVQDASHAKENLNQKVNDFVSRQRNNYFFKAMLLQFFDIIIAFNELFENKQNGLLEEPFFKLISQNYIHKGIIQKDDEGFFYCDNFLLNPSNNDRYKKGEEIKILKYAENTQDTKDRYPYFAFHFE